MSIFRKISAIVLFISAALFAHAQDIIAKTNGEVIRGTIKGSGSQSVVFTSDDVTLIQLNAKDVREFVWNGETYVSKLVLNKKKLEPIFFKIIESGVVNLYMAGGTAPIALGEPERTKVRPSFGIGMGSGGYSGAGLGGSITFGGGRSPQSADTKTLSKAIYYIERPGTGPLQEIPVNNHASPGKDELIKTILLQKLSNDEDLAERIKTAENLDAKTITAFVRAYNAMKK